MENWCQSAFVYFAQNYLQDFTKRFLHLSKYGQSILEVVYERQEC